MFTSFFDDHLSLVLVSDVANGYDDYRNLPVGVTGRLTVAPGSATAGSAEPIGQAGRQGISETAISSKDESSEHFERTKEREHPNLLEKGSRK